MVKMGIANEVCLNHVSQDSTDIKRLSKFYQELFGFEVVDSPRYKHNVIWLKLPTLNLHLIESDPDAKKLENGELWNRPTSLVGDPKGHLRGFHICLSVSNFESFRETLKEKGIETHERCLKNGKVNHVYFSLTLMVMELRSPTRMSINDRISSRGIFASCISR